MYIAVPFDLASHVLREGYKVRRRRNVPAARTVEDSIRAYGAYAREDDATVVLRIKNLPAGAEWIDWSGGYKLFLQVLPAQHLEKGALCGCDFVLQTLSLYFCVQYKH
jgi:hypothetical protein